jgi:hypothetical protein
MSFIPVAASLVMLFQPESQLPVMWPGAATRPGDR